MRIETVAKKPEVLPRMRMTRLDHPIQPADSAEHTKLKFLSKFTLHTLASPAFTVL